MLGEIETAPIKCQTMLAGTTDYTFTIGGGPGWARQRQARSWFLVSLIFRLSPTPRGGLMFSGKDL